MGLFSSKKKTVVHTEVMRVIEDAQLPDAAKTGVIKGIMHDGEISSYLLEGLVNSIAIKADHMYGYAKDHYYYGVPSSTLVTNIQGEGVVKQVIETELNKSIELDYCQFAPINSIHVAWKVLVDSYGYDAATNELTVLSSQVGHTVYLKDMVAIYTQLTVDEADPGVLNQWGTSPLAGYTPERPAQEGGALGQYRSYTPYEVDEAALEDRVEVAYVWKPGPTAEVQSATLNIPITGFDEDAEYYQVRYRWKEILVPEGPGVPEQAIWHTGFWTYLEGSGLYPEIDAIYLTEYDQLGEYFPFAYFRLSKDNLGEEALQDDPPYLTSKKLLDFLSMDYQETIDAVHENPDIDDIEQAMMIFAVPATGPSEIERKYLFEYFNTLYYNSLTPHELNESPYAVYTSRDGQAVVIKDNAFKFTMSYRGIGKRRVAGSIGPNGSHTAGTGNKLEAYSYTKRLAGGGTETVSGTIDVAHHWYRRQINNVFYDEIVVYDPRLRYHIYGKYTYTGKTGSEALLIPIDRAIVDLISMPDREELYSRSLHYIFNTRITIKAKWYQSGWFKAVAIVVAIVVTVISMGGVSALMTAIASMSASALAWAITSRILIGVIIDYSLKLFVKEVGADFAFLAAIVAAAYGVYRLGIAAPGESMWAKNLLQVSSGLSKGIQDENLRLMNNYNNELQAFELYKDEAMEDLAEAQKLLDVSTLTDPFDFIGDRPYTVFGETPSDFYLRTVHSGNIGLTGINAVSSYVDLALTLPKLDDTLGGTFYV